MIMAVLQHRVPIREIRMKSQRKMWMTSELDHLSKRKFRLFKIARSTRSEDDWSKHTLFRNFCTSTYWSAKANFPRPKHEEISSATDECVESWHGKFGHAKTRILSTNEDIMLEALTPTMEGHAVTVTDNHRHRGVVLSDDLKWSKHAQRILAAASKRAGLLRLMARDLPLPVASILFVYYVRPLLEYASPVWHGSLREENAMSLERIQASAARSLLQADWFTPKEELFRQLGWPALRWRREITSLTMFHKVLHSRPEPLRECLFQYASATSARSRRKPFQLLLPHTRTTCYRESFFCRSALPWNSLPHDIQSLKNSKSFRNALENHYESYKFTTTKTFTYHSPPPFLSNSDSMYTYTRLCHF